MALLAAMRMVHDEPPDEVIWRDVGPLDKIEVLGQNVLICTYVRPATRTIGGIEIPETATEEDRYQGRVGMVLKLGLQAFIDSEKPPVKFNGFKLTPGQWIVYRPSDGIRFQIGKRDCRLIADVHVKMRLDTPDEVY
jgi:co-chaperonin GroES (HSP10)